MICKMKSVDGKLTERRRREISEAVRNLVMSDNLDYLFVSKE